MILLKESKSNPEALERVEKFSQMLKEAMQYGYDVLLGSSFDFSPVDVVLDSAIDILLILRRMFEEGATAARKNAGLGFSEIYSDPLGNPKQFKISFPSKYYWDPSAKEIFYGLAQTFVRIKNQESIKESFHDFFEEYFVHPSSTKRSKVPMKVRAQYHWWRRQQRRFRR